MSTYWGYRCNTCNEDSPTWFNHGDKELAEVYTHRKVLIAAWQLTQTHFWNIEITVSNEYYDPGVFQYLSDHINHKLVLHNEYNAIKDIVSNEKE